jgi:hypothetical protein
MWKKRKNAEMREGTQNKVRQKEGEGMCRAKNIDLFRKKREHVVVIGGYPKSDSGGSLTNVRRRGNDPFCRT